MNIFKDYIPIGRKNRPGFFMMPKYLSIHDTANTNPGADAEAHASYLKGDVAANKPVSWHFTVDGGSTSKDGTVKPPQIYQHLPLNETGWHAGDWNGEGNMSSIGIEICENMDGDRGKAEDTAARLVAWLLQELELDINRVVQHYKWTGKDCPRVLRSRPGGWGGFIEAVQKYKNGGECMFKDVDEKRWSFKAIMRMVRLGRLSGYPDRMFRPEGPLTREEFASSEDRAEKYRYELMEKIKEAVCVISGPGGLGSGVLIGPDLIVTNVHVAMVGYSGDKIDQLTVKFNNGTVIEPKEVKIPYGDGARDCAVIKIPPVDIMPVALANMPMPGEKVFAVGCPLGHISSITEGMISHDRRISEAYGEQVRWIQTDAAINPGNSGGALVNMWGELVGIPTWKIFYSSEKNPRPTEGMNFALHLSEIRKTIQIADGVSLDSQVIVRRELAKEPVKIIM